MVVLNLTPRVLDYKIGIDEDTSWKVILNSDDEKFSGSGLIAEIRSEEGESWMNRENSIMLKLPALSGVILRQTKLEKKKIISKKTPAKKVAVKKPSHETEKIVEKKATLKIAEKAKNKKAIPAKIDRASQKIKNQ
jgi:1,4-alpha-glucan branching enzyme